MCIGKKHVSTPDLKIIHKLAPSPNMTKYVAEYMNIEQPWVLHFADSVILADKVEAIQIII